MEATYQGLKGRLKCFIKGIKIHQQCSLSTAVVLSVSLGSPGDSSELSAMRSVGIFLGVYEAHVPC